jgi:hypothetical protein
MSMRSLRRSMLSGSTPDTDFSPVTTGTAASSTTPEKISSCWPMQKIEVPDRSGHCLRRSIARWM